jgi:3-oxoadipate enol-lactonase
MISADLDGLRLHYRIDGDSEGAPVVFSNAFGTDLRIWDKVIARLPAEGLRYIRYDTRGHGLSDCLPGPYAMGALVRDLERLLDHLSVRDAVIVGISMGGMIAQGLAAKRLDIVRALVLSNTAARIGTREMWAERIAAVEGGGVAAVADATMARWFPPAFRASDEARLWRNMLTRTPVAGFTGCAQAIAGTDFYSTTGALRLPTLGIAGSEDGSTPADLVRETVSLVPGSRFELIRKAGHLPCIDAPEAYARVLTDFLSAQAH